MKCCDSFTYTAQLHWLGGHGAFGLWSGGLCWRWPQPQLLVVPQVPQYWVLLLKLLEADLLRKNFSFLFRNRAAKAELAPNQKATHSHLKNSYPKVPPPQQRECDVQSCGCAQWRSQRDQGCSRGSWGCKKPWLLLRWSWVNFWKRWCAVSSAGGLESLPCRTPLCSLLDRRCRELACWKIGCHHYKEQPSVGICMQLPPLAKKRIYWRSCPCGLAGCIVCF